MRRLAWSQLRFRTARALAVLAGMLVAATAFTVLTAASRTSQLRTTGAVSAHFQPAYDILVRPAGSRTALEARTGTVQPNFLSGIYGGISMAQYREIQRIPGVRVAAPIAMVGYTLLSIRIPVLLPPADYARPGRQLYRYATTWVSGGGSTRIAQPPSYLYVTPHRIALSQSGASDEMLPGGSRATVCPSGPRQVASNPFGPAAQSTAWCWSKIDGTGGAFVGGPRSGAFATVDWNFPMLLAAVDPAAEARLDGLNHAVTAGRYLRVDDHDQAAADGQPVIPVLAASASGLGEYSVTRIQRLAAPAVPPRLSIASMARQTRVRVTTVGTARITAAQAYRRVPGVAAGNRALIPFESYWAAAPVRYRRENGEGLTAVPVHNPLSVWRPASPTASASLPMDNAATQFRAMRPHWLSASSANVPEVRIVGAFNPARVQTFDPLSRVPLGPFQPTAAAAADTSSRAALHGGDLLPSLNLGGYVSQPANLITTLATLPALENSSYFGGALHAADPISVIRVGVAGVTGPNPVSLERIRLVAQQIAVRTGLEVDIVAGSSPRPTAISLPAGRFGQPRLALSENWVKKGVAVAILTAVDRQSVLLFTLILVVCALFVANSATTAVRGRRQELGVLACLGWTRPRLFAVVLGELATLGLAAGVLGAAAALPLSAAAGLHASPERALLAIPVAVAVAVLAGAVPAWVAARAEPASAVRPPVAAVRRGHHPAGITGLAMVNLARTPGRAAVGAFSLALGVAALTLLAAVTFAFHGATVGTLLGNAVALQVRGADYVAVAATIALGILAVGDVVFLNIRDRAAELATIRSFGWTERTLTRLVVTEGTAIGLAGSLAGAAAGLGAAAAIAGQLPARVIAIAAAACAAGTVLTAAAALLPARLLRRLPAAHLLAEE